MTAGHRPNNDLTELHQGIQHARRKVIYETLHPEAKHGGDRKSEAIKNQVENISTCSYSADAASATGVTERTVRNKTRIGEVFEKYPSWEECVGAGFFTDPNLEKYFGSAIGDGRNPAGHANYSQCVKYGIGGDYSARHCD
ncbi:MAG: hypothetical protein IPL99_15495 [Candidatus Competibacteraceae bacterium]|nr:hypothetical protein [Candidatus Competibacteraceae bacterium]